jgi:autotransporter-associated beta strand protein
VAHLISTLTINGTGNTTISGAIANGGTSTASNLIYSGSGILTLASSANTYSGTTTISSGELRLNPATTSATFASQIVFNGGKLATTSIGANTNFASSSTLKLDASSTIDLDPSTVHAIRFQRAIPFRGTVPAY